jgi:hypothetical protein
MDILLDIIQNSRENPLDLRETSFNIISNICNDCRPNQKEFRRKGGVELIKENLAYNEVDQTGNITTFLVAVLDCLNNAVFGNKRSELHFLDIEGVYVLLDLLEVSEESLKRLTLSSLCTILENNRSFQYFVEWNSSRTTINATQLLIQLYDKEDERFGVKYENGILNDLNRPLFPKISYLIKKFEEENEAQLQQHSSMVGRGEGSKVASRGSNRSLNVSTMSNHSIAAKSSKGFDRLKQAIEVSKKMDQK